MTPHLDQPRHRIVVALDRSSYARAVFERALDLAAHYAGCELHVLTVQEANAPLDGVEAELAALVAHGLAAHRRAAPDCEVRLHARCGRPVEEISALADEVRADLIVIGRFGSHRPFRRIGTVAEQVLAAAPCPTLVVQLVDPRVRSMQADTNRL